MLILLARIKIMSHDLIIAEADRRLQSVVLFPNEIWERIRTLTYSCMMNDMEKFLDRMFSPLFKIK
jgi:hypothetical protein